MIGWWFGGGGGGVIEDLFRERKQHNPCGSVAQHNNNNIEIYICYVYISAGFIM